MASLASLPNELLYYISEFCGEYSFFLRQTSRLLRETSKEIPLLALYNRLLLDGEEVPLLLDRDMLKGAVEGSYFALLEELSSFWDKEKIVKEAVILGALPVLKWLNPTWSNYLSLLAIEAGQLEVLKWGIKSSGDLWTLLWNKAAEREDIEILKWLKEVNCPRIPSSLPNICARTGNIENFKWLLANGFFYNDLSYRSAAKGGQKEFLLFLREEGFPCKEVYLGAIDRGVEMLEWLKEKEFPREDEEEYFDWAIGNRSIEVLNWLWREGYRPTEDTLSIALKDGWPDVLRWLNVRGYLSSELLEE